MAAVDNEFVAVLLEHLIEYLRRIRRPRDRVLAGEPHTEVRFNTYFSLFRQTYPQFPFPPPTQGETVHWVFYGHPNIPWLRPGVYCARGLWFVEFLNSLTEIHWQCEVNSQGGSLYCFNSIPEAVNHWRLHAEVKTQGWYPADQLQLFELASPPWNHHHWSREDFLQIILRYTLLIFLVHVATHPSD